MANDEPVVVTSYYTPDPRVGGVKRWCASDVCLSVAYVGPKSRTESPRNTKIGTSHVIGHHFQGQKVKGQLAGGGGHIVAASRRACSLLPLFVLTYRPPL